MRTRERNRFRCWNAARVDRRTSRFKLVVRRRRRRANRSAVARDGDGPAETGGASANLGILLSASERQSVGADGKSEDAYAAWGVKFEDGYFEDTSIAEHRVIFPNGKRLIRAAANPDTAAVTPGICCWTNSRMHRDSNAIWAARSASVARIQGRVSSDAEGLKNKFGELTRCWGWRMAWRRMFKPVRRDGWNAYWWTSTWPSRRGSPVNAEEMRQALADDDIFLQDYCNVRLEDAATTIALAQILACETVKLRSTGMGKRGRDLAPGTTWRASGTGR